MNTQDYIEKLKELNLFEYFESIQGEWNGKLPGVKEDRANIARDGIEALNSLIQCLEEL